MTERPPDGPGSPSGDEAAGPGPARRGGAHRAPRSRARALLVAAVLAVAALAAVLLLVRPGAGPDGTTDGDELPPVDGSAAADAADWVSAHVPDDTPVEAPEAVRSALEGTEAADRFTDRGDGDVLRVVQGPPPEGALVLAEFGPEGGSGVALVDPAPGSPTAAELERRQSLAAAVLSNPVAAPGGRAADVLRAADVDARLMGLLAVLVGRLDAHVADLPPAPGEPPDGPPARHLLIDRLGGEPVAPGTPAAEQLLAFVEAQRPPYAPDAVELTEDGVLVGFDYVSSPDAAVTAASP